MLFQHLIAPDSTRMILAFLLQPDIENNPLWVVDLRLESLGGLPPTSQKKGLRSRRGVAGTSFFRELFMSAEESALGFKPLAPARSVAAL